MPAQFWILLDHVLSLFSTEKKQDLLIRGRKEHELEDNFGFVVENNVAALQLAVTAGLQVSVAISELRSGVGHQ